MDRVVTALAVSPTQIVGGVDTHKDTHTAAALSGLGRVLGTEQFPATGAGYEALLRWLQRFGEVQVVGMEGTSSYGAGLCRYLQAQQIAVEEVERPSRKTRRHKGKSDPTDAIAAARTVLAGESAGTPKGQDGPMEVLRILRLQRRSALKEKTQVANQLHALRDTAPETLRRQLRGLTLLELADRARRFRLVLPTSPLAATRSGLGRLARRWLVLRAEAETLEGQIERLLQPLAPELLAVKGVGPDTASSLLVAVGDAPDRLRSEACLAALCGVSPLDASSGRQLRHRLNRGGNRDANRAFWVIANSRLAHDPRTQAYLARRTSQGRTKLEIIRCLKRYLARELFPILCLILQRQRSTQPGIAA